MTKDEIRWSKEFAEDVIKAEFVFSEELLDRAQKYATKNESDEFRENFAHSYRFIIAAKKASESEQYEFAKQLMNDARWAAQGTMKDVINDNKLYGLHL